jgi:hypothetical protein
MTDVFEWLEASQPAVYIRHSSWAFPITEVFHIIGFIFLVGSAFLFDLRLLGVSKHISVKSLAGHLLPWSRRSLFIVIPSGLLLFISQAGSLSTSSVFAIKLALILMAFTNAGIFHRYTFRNVSEWDRLLPSPPAAKVAAVISLLLWTAVITLGRLISYF